MKTVRVALAERSYPIYVGEGLLADSTLLSQHIQGQQVLIVSNDTVATLYIESLKSACRHYQCDVVLLPDGEQYKTWETLNEIFTALLTRQHHRDTTLIALGGGVIGDLAGFAAAIYQRGVAVIQIPTTLLAQVDAAIGGKTAINHPLAKNMLGAFHQPQCVIADITTLQSLPLREFRAGIAEVVKYGLIRNAAFFESLERNKDVLMARDTQVLADVIYQCCAIKAEIVSCDEKESGLRALLNLGHTFAHAIENQLGYGVWLHGEAVSVGLVKAAELSQCLGWLSQAEVLRIRNLLMAVGLPTELPSQLNAKALLTVMTRDKKIMGNKLRLIALESIGKAAIVQDVSTRRLQEILESIGREK